MSKKSENRKLIEMGSVVDLSWKVIPSKKSENRKLIEISFTTKSTKGCRCLRSQKIEN